MQLDASTLQKKMKSSHFHIPLLTVLSSLACVASQTICPLTLNGIQERGFDVPSRCIEKESVSESDGIWLCVIFAFDPLDDPGNTCTYDIAFFRPKINRIHALDIPASLSRFGNEMQRTNFTIVSQGEFSPPRQYVQPEGVLREVVLDARLDEGRVDFLEFFDPDCFLYSEGETCSSEEFNVNTTESFCNSDNECLFTQETCIEKGCESPSEKYDDLAKTGFIGNLLQNLQILVVYSGEDKNEVPLTTEQQLDSLGDFEIDASTINSVF